MEAEYARISDALQRLRESRERLSVYGSGMHGFRVGPPLSQRDLVEFEKLHRIQLPPEYRGFLTHVGNGGAGPGCGVFKLGEMDDAHTHKRWRENDGFVGSLSKSFPHVSAWNDLSGQPEYDGSREHDLAWEDAYNEELDEWLQEWYWHSRNVDGAIPICHLGCAQRQWLVVSGAEAGNIWDDMRADYGGLRPLQTAGCPRVTFLQWYWMWLEEALEQLGTF